MLGSTSSLGFEVQGLESGFRTKNLGNLVLLFGPRLSGFMQGF